MRGASAARVARSQVRVHRCSRQTGVPPSAEFNKIYYSVVTKLLVSHPLAECYKVGAALTYNLLKWQVKGTFTAYLRAKCYKVSAE